MQNYKKKINMNTVGTKNFLLAVENIRQKAKISQTKMFLRKLFCIFALLNFCENIKVIH